MEFIIIFLHIDGINLNTKRNIPLECISMSFLMFRNDILKPHFLGTKISKHSNAMLRGIQWKFMMKDFLVIIGKILRIWKGVIGGGIKLARYPGGYASSLATSLEENVSNNHSLTRSNSDICGVPVKIQCN